MWLSKRLKLWNNNNNNRDDSTLNIHNNMNDALWSMTREIASASLQELIKQFHSTQQTNGNNSNNNHSILSLRSKSNNNSNNNSASKRSRVYIDSLSPLHGVPYLEIRYICVSGLNNNSHVSSSSNHGRYFNIKTSTERIKTHINNNNNNNNNGNNQQQSVEYWDREHYLLKIDQLRESSISNRQSTSSSSSSPSSSSLSLRNLRSRSVMDRWPLSSSLSSSNTRRNSYTPNLANLKNGEVAADTSSNNSNSNSSGGGGEGSEMIEFELWNYDRKKNQYVGSAYLNVDALPRGKFVLIQEPLYGCADSKNCAVLSCLVRAHHFGTKSSCRIEQKNYRSMIDYQAKYDSFYDVLSPQVFGHVTPKKSSSVAAADADVHTSSSEVAVNEDKESADEQNNVIDCAHLRNKLNMFISNEKMIDTMCSVLSQVNSVHEMLTFDWLSRMNLRESQSELEEANKDRVYDSVSIKVAVAHSPVDDEIKKVCSRYGANPAQTMFNISEACEVQMFHCAVIVGPYILDWDSTGVCVPKPLSSSDILLAHNVATIHSVSELNRVLLACSKALVQWNTECSFSELGGRAKTGNSFTFMNSILNSMGYELGRETVVERFISSLSMCGTGQMRFSMSNEFKLSFKFDFDSIVFDNHGSLDQFVKELFRVDPNWETTWTEESFLLHSYDKYFWVHLNRANSLIACTKQRIETLRAQQHHPERVAQIDKEIVRIAKKLGNLEPYKNQCPLNPDLSITIRIE